MQLVLVLIKVYSTPYFTIVLPGDSKCRRDVSFRGLTYLSVLYMLTGVNFL
jgi:hypothetical protein